MGRISQIEIKEDLETLNSYKSHVRSYKSSRKLELLLVISSDDNRSLGDISKHLSIDYSTLHRWLRTYREEGIEKYLRPSSRNRASRIITPDIHKELEELLNQEQAVFSGYKDVQRWLEVNHGVKIQYQWLWKYLTTKLGTSLKVPRKSNIKKDKEASVEFFKTAGHLQ
jgi:transposase